MDAVRRLVEEKKRRAAAGGEVGARAAAATTARTTTTQATPNPQQQRPSKRRRETEPRDGDAASSSSSSESDSSDSSDDEREEAGAAAATAATAAAPAKPADDEEEEDPDLQSKQARSTAALDAMFAEAVESSATAEDRVRGWIQRGMAAWRSDLSAVPEAERRTAKGRQELRNFQDSLIDLRPLVEGLKARGIAQDVVSRLDRIVAACDKREYVKATEEYIGLTIGNAAWPIGVTQVGIHSRAGRSKIEDAKVQHIMKNETSRLYLTSFKRLMTRAQERSPAKPSKMVG